MHLWFCPAHQWSKRAVFLASPSSGSDTAETTEGARGGQLVQAEGGEGGGGWMGWVVGGVWTCPSHGWSDCDCAGLHIWKRSCRREGGVNANEQGEQRCYISTSSSRRGQGGTFKAHCDEAGVAVRLSLIPNCILEKGTATSSTPV